MTKASKTVRNVQINVKLVLETVLLVKFVKETELIPPIVLVQMELMMMDLVRTAYNVIITVFLVLGME